MNMVIVKSWQECAAIRINNFLSLFSNQIRGNIRYPLAPNTNVLNPVFQINFFEEHPVSLKFLHYDAPAVEQILKLS